MPQEARGPADDQLGKKLKKICMALRWGVGRDGQLQSFDQLRDVTAHNLLPPALAAHLCTSV